MIIWITGQPGAGKTTLARWIKNNHIPAVIVDGDELREALNNFDYSEAGRKRNVEDAQKIAMWLHSQHNDVIVSMVSPYREQRESFKSQMGTDIVEIYVHTSIPRKDYQVENYEPPIKDFIDIFTDNTIDYEKIRTIHR